jgi:hypothetical protein
MLRPWLILIFRLSSQRMFTVTRATVSWCASGQISWFGEDNERRCVVLRAKHSCQQWSPLTHSPAASFNPPPSLPNLVLQAMQEFAYSVRRIMVQDRSPCSSGRLCWTWNMLQRTAISLHINHILRAREHWLDQIAGGLTLCQEIVVMMKARDVQGSALVVAMWFGLLWRYTKRCTAQVRALERRQISSAGCTHASVSALRRETGTPRLRTVGQSGEPVPGASE